MTDVHEQAGSLPRRLAVRPRRRRDGSGLGAPAALLVFGALACGGAAGQGEAVTEPRRETAAARAGQVAAAAPVASASEGGRAAAAPAPDPASRLLADPEAELPADKVLLRRAGQVRLAADGRVVAAAGARYELDDEPALTVVAQTGEQVRVVSVWGRARLLVWADRDDLADVAVREAALEGGAPPRGVTLRPGAPVEVVAREGERVRVRRADGELAFEGWTAADAIGAVFRRSDDAERLPGFGNALVRCRSELAAAPGGPALAVVAPDDDGACEAEVEVEVLGEPDGGLVEISIEHPAYVARGFVAAAAVQAPEGTGYGALYGIGGIGLGGRDGPEVEVPPGTCLFADRYGEPVGVVTHELVFAPGEAPAERSWVAGRIETRWGDVPVWAFVESAAEGRWRRCQ